MGHKNLDRILVPHVVSMAEEPIIVPRRPHTWTIRPCQWHIARGGPTIEEKLQKGG